MTLVPKLPPGRVNRKALQFADDIHRLRADGYTFSAIRTALLDAGISVSLSTVKREAAKRATFATRHQQAFTTEPLPPTRTVHAPNVDVPPARLRMPQATTGREIAEAFFAAHPSNPLFATQETS